MIVFLDVFLGEVFRCGLKSAPEKKLKNNACINSWHFRYIINWMLSTCQVLVLVCLGLLKKMETNLKNQYSFQKVKYICHYNKNTLRYEEVNVKKVL